MPIVSFMPYHPDEKIDRTAADFHVWNWWGHREKRILDAAIRSYLDKHFGSRLLVELGKLRKEQRAPHCFRVHISERSSACRTTYGIRSLAGFSLAFRVFRSEQKNDTAHPRIQTVVQTLALCEPGKPERPPKATVVGWGAGGTYGTLVYCFAVAFEESDIAFPGADESEPS